MKTKYRKFVIGNRKYCFWLRIIQTLDDVNGVKEISKAETMRKRRARNQKDYEHKQRRKTKRLRKVVLGLSRARAITNEI